ncbi:MAG: putative DNA ligase [Candidatus Micrarchaeota archaeon]|nr:MAG: putative DNA ligase [Candidatus Micrarchaeota archaeon]
MLFDELADYYSKLEEISSRIAMVDILADMLSKLNEDEIDKAIYITQGVLLPPYQGIEIGIADKMAEDSISLATGYKREDIEKLYKQLGDLGSVVEHILNERNTAKIDERKLSILDVYNTVYDIAKRAGEGSKAQKTKLLAGLITNLSPKGAKYAVRYVLGQLRLGVGDATVIEALSLISTKTRGNKDIIENAYNLCSDLGYIGKLIKQGGIDAIKDFKISLFRPIRPALAERLPTAQEILQRMNGRCAVEYKYDGFRCQIHKKGNEVMIFSRRLENTTAMLPDIVNAVKKEIKADEIIFEGEAIGYDQDTGEFFPFQETIQRKRKHDVEEKAESIPLKLFAFDLMYLNGESYLNKPYSERRAKLEELIKDSKESVIRLTQRIITDNPVELENYFDNAITNGLEGIVAKDLNAPYIAGARKFSWIKLKRSYKGELSDTLDLVIVGYDVGTGKRAEIGFGAVLAATYNKERDIFETICKIGSGYTDKEREIMRDLLRKIVVDHKPARVDSIIKPDYWVEPRYVITVKADEITRSPTHTCGRTTLPDGTTVGYALRFPRLVSQNDDPIREDKAPEDATTTQEVIEMYNMQRKSSVGEDES